MIFNLDVLKIDPAQQLEKLFNVYCGADECCLS